MSIYPVKLKKWFPKGDEMHSIARIVVKCSECMECKKKGPKFRNAIGHHSLPWGNGDVWCNQHCYKKYFKREFKE